MNPTSLGWLIVFLVLVTSSSTLIPVVESYINKKYPPVYLYYHHRPDLNRMTFGKSVFYNDDDQDYYDQSASHEERYYSGGGGYDQHQSSYSGQGYYEHKVDWLTVLLAVLSALAFAAIFSTDTFQTFLTNLFNCTAISGREFDDWDHSRIVNLLSKEILTALSSPTDEEVIINSHHQNLSFISNNLKTLENDGTIADPHAIDCEV